ncbi:hypothetical protein [Burkholderia sp. Ac-20379]|uniref:hypothetical protein n=1 Tax=Burkholderia sp. Ac-20379 TaxID=2703900 RepID=UPI00197FC87B|nr:hypothetical protein [Burkholderia sp. Ac-20379]MBN3722939.1 hypothetical protein [Burkholderia sp. Ac-20379]
MRNVAAVNRGIGVAGLALCVLLAVLALPGWWYLRHYGIADDGVVRTRVLRPGLRLYVVRRPDEGAASPFVYDYYLSGRDLSRASLGGLMDRRAPFLTADNDVAEVGVDSDDSLCVSLLGHVYGFANRVALDTGGRRVTIAISLVARPPGDLAQRSAARAHAAARSRPNGQSGREDEGGAVSVCKMQP